MLSSGKQIWPSRIENANESRACLKDVPDNLIFHLKRFDFDINTMMRSKINDEFYFPQRIDMTPFNVEQLSNPEELLPPDIFELVGVLVHSGTAESGHYYSYIRARPLAAGSPESWVEFNDAEVRAFDPSSIPGSCFGGISESFADMSPIRFNKVYNAYMLFYQRVSSIETAKTIYKPQGIDNAISLPLSTDLSNHIALDNELFIRCYCLQNPHHASFIRALLDRMRWDDANTCSDDHQIEKKAFWLTLDHLEEVFSRSKDLPQVEAIFYMLEGFIRTCPYCAFLALDWTVTHTSALRNLLLRNPYPLVRNGFSKLLSMAFRTLKKHTRNYNGDLSQDEVDVHRKNYSNMFLKITECLSELFKQLLGQSRAWDDYFDLLTNLASIDREEAKVLLDEDFLERCLHIVWLDRDDTKKLRHDYPTYWRLIEKGRKFSHRGMLDLLSALLSRIDLISAPCLKQQDRCRSGDKYSLTTFEWNLIRSLPKFRKMEFLRKILEPKHNPPAAHKILEILLESEPELNELDPIRKTLEDGLRVEPAHLSAPFLEATLIFVQHAPNVQVILALVDYTAKGVESINNRGGMEHLNFFQQLPRTRNHRLRKPNIWYEHLATDKIADWAPTLLIYNDKQVRDQTVETLRQLLFNRLYEDRADDEHHHLRRIGRELCLACVEKLTKSYLETHAEVEMGALDSINSVIRHCLTTLYDSNVEEDVEFSEHAQCKYSCCLCLHMSVLINVPTVVMSQMETLTVLNPEELASGEFFQFVKGFVPMRPDLEDMLN